jgi:hypothetical protein
VASIADLFVKLIADTKGFEGEVTRGAQKAGDAAAKTMKERLTGGLKGLGQAIFAGFGLGAGISAFNALSGAVRGAVGWLKEAGQEAIADEESINRLGASLQANIPGWDGNTDAIEENIEAAQRLGFTDEQLRDALTVLVGATHDVGKAQEYMATAMDLARFKGIDLRTASEALIKVSGGHYRALAQLGIKLREGATATEALAAVQKVASGQAEAYADTTAGIAASIEIIGDELQEDLGKIAVPLIREFMLFIRDEVLPVLSDMVDWLGNAGDEAIRFSVDLYEATGGLVGMSRARAADIAQGREFIDNLRHSAGAVSGLGAGFTATGQEIDGSLSGPVEAEHQRVVKSLKDMLTETAALLIAGQTDWQEAVEGYAQFLEENLLPADEKAQILEQIEFFTGELVKAQASGDAEWIAEVEATLEILRDRIRTGGADAVNSWAEGMQTATAAAALYRRGLELGGTFRSGFQAGADLGDYDPTAPPVPAPTPPPTTTTTTGGTGGGYKPPEQYQEGTPWVPATGLYGLHEGEMVVPSEAAVALRRLFGLGVQGLGAAPNVVNNYNLNVSGSIRVDEARDAIDELRRLAS